MKILFIQDQLRGGGTERQSIELATHLRQSGADVELRVGAEGGQLDDFARSQLKGALYFISKNPGWRSHLQALLLFRKTRTEEVTVVCMGRWGHLLFGLLPKCRRTKLISTVRGSRGFPFLYRRCIRKSDQLIANSQWALEDTIRQIGPENCPAAGVVHNPLTRPELLEIGPAEKAKARVGFGIESHSFVLLNAARLTTGKGQADLIRATAEMKNPKVQLRLLGEGSEKKTLQTLAADLNISDQVFFLGFEEDVRPHFAAADLFLSASTLDSLPNALIEAHAAALPIVAYPTSGIPEIVDHEATGLLCRENSVAELTHWIRHAMQQPEWRVRTGKNAREKIRAQFSREQLNRNFKELVLGN